VAGLESGAGAAAGLSSGFLGELMVKSRRKTAIETVWDETRRAAERNSGYREKEGDVGGIAGEIIGGCCDAVGVVEAEVSPAVRRGRALRLRGRVTLPSNASITVRES
jgi:hypothetical protein